MSRFFKHVGNFLRNLEFEHSCEDTINKGTGRPCSKCNDAYLEEKSKREHESYVSSCKKTSTLILGTAEYEEIRSLFESGCRYKVFRIDKNDNWKLLSRYENAKREHVNAVEKLLYHGAKCAENHKSIFDNGFLISRSLDGLLGRGIYFADNMSYSDNGYVFSTCVGNNNIKTILLCKVLLVNGKYKKQNNIQAVYDETLCHPKYMIYYKKCV